MRSGSVKRGVVALILLLVVAAGAGAWITRAFASPSGAPVRVVIPESSTYRVATDSLVRAGVVSWPRLFRVYGRVTGTDRELKPGTYLFRRNTPWRAIISALTGGEGLVRSVTIPEGFAISQIVPLLADKLDVPADSVLAATRDSALLSRLRVPIRSLEGYLFPDTYAFPEGTTARRAVAEMVRRFEREWQPEWDQRLAALARSRHEIVTLASIVEEEAKLGRERPVIAGVYYNRLRLGMPLQADPTVQYARRVHTERVTYRDLEIDSPYNTYKYPGLPPGPIASPGGASLRATLFPREVAYLYFVAFPDGHHVFSETLEEHNAQRAVAASRRASDTASARPTTRGR